MQAFHPTIHQNRALGRQQPNTEEKTMPSEKNVDKKNESKKQSGPTTRPEIKLKSSPKADAMKKAPDEVIAMAIREALIKDKEGR